MKLDDLLEQKKEEKEQEALEKEPYVAKKPNLITRYAAGMLDFIVAAILTIGFFFACRYTILDPMGHQDDVDFIHNSCAESGLYIEYYGGYYEVTNDDYYHGTTDPEEKYEDRILYYYTNCDYPIGLNMISSYFSEKTAVNYWNEINPDENYDLPKGSTMEEIHNWMVSHYETKENVTAASVDGWLSNQYETAIAVFDKNPEYVQHAEHATLTEYFIILISEVLGLGIYYILLPLVLKRGATPFMLVFKIVVANKKGLKFASKSQILLRYFLLIVINMLIPTVWYFFMPSSVGYLALLFPMAEIMFIGISYSNSGIHDFAAQTYLADFKDHRLVAKKLEAPAVSSKTNDIEEKKKGKK